MTSLLLRQRCNRNFAYGLILTKIIDFYYRCVFVNFICFDQLLYEL